MVARFSSLWLGVAACCLVVSAPGRSQEEADIWKSPGELPRVSCDFASSYSALTLFRFLGGPFLVGRDSMDECEEHEPLAKGVGRPVIGPGSPGIGPRCQCPESFVADLEERRTVLGSGLPLGTPADDLMRYPASDDPTDPLDRGGPLPPRYGPFREERGMQDMMRQGREAR